MVDEAQIEEVVERIAALTRDLLPDLQRAFPEGFTVPTLAVVLEIAQENGNYVYFNCSDPRKWAQTGFFRFAMQAAEDNIGGLQEKATGLGRFTNRFAKPV